MSRRREQARVLVVSQKFEEYGLDARAFSGLKVALTMLQRVPIIGEQLVLFVQGGQTVEAPSAWLDVTTGTLEVLQQRYERRSEYTYWYEAPRFQYAALLEVAPVGFVLRYPGLWEAERARP